MQYMTLIIQLDQGVKVSRDASPGSTQPKTNRKSGESSRWSHRRSQDPVDAFVDTPKKASGGRFQKKHLSMSMNIGDIQKLMLLLCEKARNAM